MRARLLLLNASANSAAICWASVWSPPRSPPPPPTPAPSGPPRKLRGGVPRRGPLRYRRRQLGPCLAVVSRLRQYVGGVRISVTRGERVGGRSRTRSTQADGERLCFRDLEP